jgi:hypothetical protein
MAAEATRDATRLEAIARAARKEFERADDEARRAAEWAEKMIGRAEGMVAMQAAKEKA